MKKTLRMLSAMFFLSSLAWAGSPGVTFLLRSGQKVSFAFSQKPVISVSNADLSVSVSGVQRVSYAYADVQRIYLSDDVVSGIAPVQADPSQQSVTFIWQDGVLRASGLNVNEQVRVFGLDGKLALSGRAQADGSVQLSFFSIPQGVYVVRTQGGLSYKLFNK